MKPLSAVTRPKCRVCQKPLPPHYAYVKADATPAEVAAYRARKRVVRPNDDKLLYLGALGEETVKATWLRFDGTYGMSGENNFHAIKCAAQYGHDAARLLPALDYTAKKEEA